MSSTMKDLLMLLGRILFSLMFIVAGIDKIMNFNQTISIMANNAIPYTNILLILSIIMELGGGLMILLGWRARLGALLIFIFIIPVTYFFHSFWTIDPGVVANQMQHFMKNLTILGGALFIMAAGPGRCSIDRRGVE